MRPQQFILTGIVILLCFQSCDNSNTDFSFSHTDPIGSSAKAFLTADDFEKLTVEIDYYTEYPLSSEVVENLQSFLEQRLNKPGGVSIVIDDELNEEDVKVFYNGLRVIDMEENNRDIYATENNLAAYLIILNGRITNSDAGGGAYYNTSAGIFPEMFYPIADTTDGISREMLLSTVLNHEVGHFLGLVHIGTPMVENHAFRAGKGHCMVEICLMWPGVRIEDISKLKGLKKPPELDPFCIQDLQANGGK